MIWKCSDYREGVMDSIFLDGTKTALVEGAMAYLYVAGFIALCLIGCGVQRLIDVAMRIKN